MKLVLFLLGMLFVAVQADMYLHNPPGCNDRNRERNDNRANGNRLFDSQNNGKGGYAWRGNPMTNAGPNPMTYLTDSVIRIEYTNQHACGANPNVNCQALIQWSYDDTALGFPNAAPKSQRANWYDSLMPGLRDGYPEGDEEASDNQNAGYRKRAFAGTAGQNNQGTNTIPDDRFGNDPNNAQNLAFYHQGAAGGVEFGMHEDHAHYWRCKRTQRNKGLFTADQKLRGNAARFTRQNPNGGRRGLECPEERDYYPYWNDAMNPWCDAAVLVSNTGWCPFYRSNSPNVKRYGFCEGVTSNIPITEQECGSRGGTWNQGRINPLCNEKPDCRRAMESRDNHLGNAVATDSDGNPRADKYQPETAHYNWRVPQSMAGKTVILRVRYNMSSDDAGATTQFMRFAENGGRSGVGANAALNCERVTTDFDAGSVDLQNQAVDPTVVCKELIANDLRPLTNRPYVKLFDEFGPEYRLSIALNTNQNGRTFQDRTYVFNVVAKPDNIDATGTVYNLNVRGRRGNIVQCYPAVEYDFVPNILNLKQGDWIHLQIHGSDFNAPKNPNNGEGWRYSDRSNMVEMDIAGHNFPIVANQMEFFNFATSKGKQNAIRWALVGQENANCEVYDNGDNGEQNSITNCGKLNAAPQLYPPNWESGLMPVGSEPRGFSFVSTRNNNLSNRSQKNQIIVEDNSSLSSEEIAGIVVGSVVAAALVVGAILFYGARRPKTVAGRFYGKTTQGCARCIPACAKMNKQHENLAAASTSTKGAVYEGQTTGSTKFAPPDMEYTRH